MGLFDDLTGNIFNKTADIIDQIVVDKDLAANLKSELATKGMEFNHDLLSKEIDARAGLLAAELAGSDIQRNWRPHLMYTIMALLIFMLAIVPICASLGWVIPIKVGIEAVPKQLWTLLTVGVGGYLPLRSVEKIAKDFTNRPK